MFIAFPRLFLFFAHSISRLFGKKYDRKKTENLSSYLFVAWPFLALYLFTPIVNHGLASEAFLDALLVTVFIIATGLLIDMVLLVFLGLCSLFQNRPRKTNFSI